MIFIIPIYSSVPPPYSCIDSFTTTYLSDFARYGYYEIHHVIEFIIP